MLGFLGKLASAVHGQGAAANPIQVHRLCVADIEVELRCWGPAVTAAVLPALAHLVKDAEQQRVPKIIFHVWDEITSVLPPAPPFEATDYHRYGQRALKDDGTRVVMHAPAERLLYAYDRSTRQGYFCCQDASALSIYDRAAPLQPLFQWALVEFGWQIIHAAGVGMQSGGVLLVGNSGAGKSTTALSCLGKSGLRFLSDDKCLVRLEPQPRAQALFDSAKIKGDMLERFPQFQPMLVGWDPRTEGGKGLIHLHETHGAEQIDSFPIRALVLPCVCHSEKPNIQPISPAELFRHLGPSTVIWLPGTEAGAFHFIAKLARQVPCYRIALTTQPEHNVAAIRRLLEEVG